MMHNNVLKKASDTEPLPKIILIGNPNVGKSVIFGFLTGRYVTVSNYPGTTVEVSRGKATVNRVEYSVIDTPGINSLLPMSEDEEVTRNILLNERQERIVQVVDAKNLKRGLLISIELAEMGLPFILDLNLYDEATSRGISIDTEKLSEILGIDVVDTIATRRKGLDRLMKGVEEPRVSPFTISYDKEIEGAIEEVESLLPEANISKRSLALMIISGDMSLNKWLHDNLSREDITRIEEISLRLRTLYHEPLGYVINRRRMAEASRITGDVFTTSKVGRKGFSNRFEHLAMHPFWGIPILLAVLYIMYLFVGSLGAGTLVDFLEGVVFEKYFSPWATRIVEGFIPFTFIQELLVGEYGLITMALSYSIAIVLPIVGTFFIAFSILEDSGYLPRLAVMVNKIFRLMGLNGKAVLPMVLGLGCATMATMTTRILDSKKDRVIVTLLLALGVPCSAQLGVILGMLGGVSFSAMMVWLGVVISVLFFTGFLAARVVPGEPSDFIYELPPIRLPHFSNIAYKTVARIDWYLKEAVPLFILGTLVLFTMDKLNILGIIETAASPIVERFLGLPARATDAFLIGFLRRDYGAAGLYALQKDGLLDPVQTVVSLVTMTLFIPCIANLFMIIKERGVVTALWMLAFIFPFALLVGGALNFSLRLIGAAF
ncbi:MAG: ferrous iron transport protein B [Deltaproteobacteria bacterium]|nr:ferrous iron transport protein B [Deltaproteobacteria bacterium]